MALDMNGAATQEETQQTQLSDVGSQRQSDTHLWGYLIPCSSQLRRIDFNRDKRVYKIGRNREERQGNDHVLGGMKISECFLVLMWRRGLCMKTRAVARQLVNKWVFLSRQSAL